jgi:hypothetical protein
MKPFGCHRSEMSELFDKDNDTIGLHLKNIFSSGELDEDATTEYCSDVLLEGKRNIKRKKKDTITKVIVSLINRNN